MNRCERCQGMTAEYIFGFFQLCRYCDRVEARKVPKPCADSDWDDEPTHPGFCMHGVYYTATVGTKYGDWCLHCGSFLGEPLP